MRGVEVFLRSNGWNMHEGDLLFFQLQSQMRSLFGLPWRGLTGRTFLALTQDGVLYVPLRTFGPESDGVAYNPMTNRFPSTINGFKPVGGGWYTWKQTMAPPGERKY
jgi:hypothetical protein